MGGEGTCARAGLCRAFQVSDLKISSQVEKAYLKQPSGISRPGDKRKSAGKGGNRFYKNVGLGFRTPRGAIEGDYIDKKCPFTGNVSIRGRILTGVVHSTKMNRTIILRRDYLHFIKKYNRFEKRHKNTPVHVSPAFRVKPGDEILAGQCRPLSKTVRFNCLKIIRTAGGKKGFDGM